MRGGGGRRGAGCGFVCLFLRNHVPSCSFRRCLIEEISLAIKIHLYNIVELISSSLLLVGGQREAAERLNEKEV